MGNQWLGLQGDANYKSPSGTNNPFNGLWPCSTNVLRQVIESIIAMQLQAPADKRNGSSLYFFHGNIESQ